MLGLKGGCLCGSITYEIHGDPMMTAICHCKDCQKKAGTTFSLIISTSSIFILKFSFNLLMKFSTKTSGADAPDEIPIVLQSCSLSNGILLSAWNNETVTLPIDVNQYEARLQEKIDSASLRTPKNLKAKVNMEKSYR